MVVAWSNWVTLCKSPLIGDSTVYTSGTGAVFKSGIPIGKLISVKDNSSTKYTVDFYSDFSQLKYVFADVGTKKEILQSEIDTDENDNKINNPLDAKLKILEDEKKIIEETNLKFQQENEKLKKIQEKLKKDENDFKSKNNILNDEEKKKTINKLRSDYNDFNNLKNKKEKEFNKKKNEYINKLLVEINKILVSYVDKNSIDIVIKKENLITGKKNLDITKFILDELNKKNIKF